MGGIQSGSVSFGGSGAGGSFTATLPLRLLVVADFTGKRLAIGEDPSIARIRVDKQSFNEAMERLEPALWLQVPNKLGSSEPTLELSLKFRSIEDFRPERVAAQVPDLAKLVAMRAQLAQGGGADALATAQDLPGAGELVSLLGGTPSAPASSSASNSTEDAIDSLLDAIAEETKAPPKASSSIGSVIGAIGGGAAKAASGNAGAQAWIDDKLSQQLDAILHDPAFVALEEAWRGLRFLVERTDFASGIILEILSSAPEDLARIVAEEALEAEYNAPGDPPLSAVIVDHLFDRTARDINILQALAQAAEKNQAPVITGVGAAFLGEESLHSLGTRGSLQEVATHYDFAKWLGLRQTDPARWLGVVVNRFLLRHPWGSADTPVKGFAYKESVTEGTGGGMTWGNAAWALASCITASFARDGWPSFIGGAKKEGLVSDLPLRKWEARKGVSAQITLETGFSDAHAQDMARAGVITAQCGANSDKAFFSYVPSAYFAKQYQDATATQDAAMKSLISYQLYAGRVANFLMGVLAEARGAGSNEAIAATLQSKTLDLFRTARGAAPAETVQVSVADNPDRPERAIVTFEIVPPFKFYNMTPRLELTVEAAR